MATDFWWLEQPADPKHPKHPKQARDHVPVTWPSQANPWVQPAAEQHVAPPSRLDKIAALDLSSDSREDQKKVTDDRNMGSTGPSSPHEGHARAERTVYESSVTARPTQRSAMEDLEDRTAAVLKAR